MADKWTQGATEIGTPDKWAIGATRVNVVPGMERLGGVAPEPAAAPIPGELQETPPQPTFRQGRPSGVSMMGPSNQAYGKDHAVVQMYGDSANQFGKGMQTMRHAQTGDEFAGGLSQSLRGFGGLTLPIALPSMAAYPVSSLVGLGVGAGVGAGTEAISNALDVGPGKSELAGTLTGGAAGFLSGGLGSQASRARSFVQSRIQKDPNLPRDVAKLAPWGKNALKKWDSARDIWTRVKTGEPPPSKTTAPKKSARAAAPTAKPSGPIGPMEIFTTVDQSTLPQVSRGHGPVRAPLRYQNPMSPEAWETVNKVRQEQGLPPMPPASPPLTPEAAAPPEVVVPEATAPPAAAPIGPRLAPFETLTLSPPPARPGAGVARSSPSPLTPPPSETQLPRLTLEPTEFPTAPPAGGPPPAAAGAAPEFSLKPGEGTAYDMADLEGRVPTKQDYQAKARRAWAGQMRIALERGLGKTYTELAGMAPEALTGFLDSVAKDLGLNASSVGKVQALLDLMKPAGQMPPPPE